MIRHVVPSFMTRLKYNHDHYMTVGKTWVLNLIADMYKIQHKKVLTCGLTGLAGSLLSGPTVHYHMMLKHFRVILVSWETALRDGLNRTQRSLFGCKLKTVFVRQADIIICDEVSMMTSDVCELYL